MGNPVSSLAHAVLIAIFGREPTDDEQLRAETAIRLRAGGERLSIPKRAPKEDRYRRLRADLDAGLSYRDAAKKHGVSARTAKRAGKTSD